MTDLRKAAEMALEALEYMADYDTSVSLQKAAIEALRQALAQPEQPCCCGEPDALGVVHRKDNPCYVAQPEQAHTDHPMRHWDRTCPACNEGATMTKQPEALRLADEMAKAIFPKLCLIDKATDELRRLHEVNQELVEALKQIDLSGIRYKETPVECVGRLRAIAVDALTKATGESK